MKKKHLCTGSVTAVIKDGCADFVGHHHIIQYEVYHIERVTKRNYSYKNKTGNINIFTYLAPDFTSCAIMMANIDGKPYYDTAKMGTLFDESAIGTYYTLEVFEIEEGYRKEEKNKILLGIFGKEDSESYFSTNTKSYGLFDNKINGTTEFDESDFSNGWENNIERENGNSLSESDRLARIEKVLANVQKYNKDSTVIGGDLIHTYYGWGVANDRTKAIICEELLTEINKENKTQVVGYANLGVKYRPTVDLGLYNDVVNAVVSVNSKTETYIYDKRATNGESFKFGVNKYEINSTPDENAYVEYFGNLSNGQTTTNKNEIPSNDYYNYLREEDVFSNISPGDTTTGTVEAGGYNNYPISIKVTYKLRVVNQSETKATVTEIVDYYSKDFDVIGVYNGDENQKGQVISYSNKSIYSNLGEKKEASDKYRTIFIPLNENNKTEYIYIELEMKNPREVLKDLKGDGYKTLNYAEINGYKTDIGVIDIDSMPGNILYENYERFENGIYEDDESKSPVLIFKNPENTSRTITGILFEDATDEKINISAERNGDGSYQKDNDTPIAGGIVQLIEVDESGNPIGSGTDGGAGIRAQTLTDQNGNYTFTKIIPGNYKVQFIYGGDGQGEHNQTVLINTNGGSNAKSYNGQDYENTIKLQNNTGNKYWYTVNPAVRNSDATDNQERRNAVIAYSTTLTNHIAEVFNSWKDSQPNMDLVRELNINTSMFANTELMSIEVENIQIYDNREVKGAYDKTPENYKYDVENIDFGIVERERAELQIIKTVKEISIVDSSGKQITGGKAGENIKYVKWIQGPGGFVDMEIDSELLSGATLKVTYEIKVENTSEAGNNISQIQVVDYVSNNLNFDKAQNPEWTPVTVEQVKPYINNTSLDSTDISNKIDLSTYQTILMTTFNGAGTKTLTLEKNLSSEEDSNFNYENQVEIVSSYNPIGRGDYSSIYGNLDPTTYTSRQGNLNWDNIGSENQNGFRQMPTDTTVVESGVKVDNPNAIRLAEKDSGNAEEVIITPPTGTKGIVFETQHYILAIIGLLSLAGAIILIKKYNKIGKE